MPLNYHEWIKDTSQFNEDFIKNVEEYFPEVDVQYIEKLSGSIYWKIKWTL